MISVLLPTRGRPTSLLASIDSLIRQAEDADRVEVLLRFDDDDMDTYEAVEKYLELFHSQVIIGPRHGYAGIHLYNNELCEIANGSQLFLWNDDATMGTYAWDAAIEDFAPFDVILNPSTNHSQAGSNLFPVLPRRLYDVMGHFSLNRHCDTYLEQIANALGLNQPLPEVEIFHDMVDVTGGHDDTTAAEREYDPNYWTDAVQDLIKNDIAKIRDYLVNRDV